MELAGVFFFGTLHTTTTQIADIMVWFLSQHLLMEMDQLANIKWANGNGNEFFMLCIGLAVRLHLASTSCREGEIMQNLGIP